MARVIGPSERLAKQARQWRGAIPARVAAAQLGIPLRTWQNIEQGRGFAYPQLLRLAMQDNPCLPEEAAKQPA